MQQHALSAAFPAMSNKDFQALKHDIEMNGQREPVIVLDGQILDGWHRYRACLELGITPTHIAFDQAQDPMALVVSHNLQRRHLSASQRAAAIVSCSDWAPAGRPHNLAPGARFATNKALAGLAGVSSSTIRDAKRAVKAGLINSVKDGVITAKEAAGQRKARPENPMPTSCNTAPNSLETQQALATAPNDLDQLRQENDVLRHRVNDLLLEKADLIQRVKALQSKLEHLEQPA